MDRQAARFIIKGEVQGVGFRAWVVREAWKLGLDGWARNRTDETVEIMAIGSGSAIDQLEDACRNGPPSAQVTSLSREEAPDDGSRGFAQWPTL
jgi:acylphosphatase